MPNKKQNKTNSNNEDNQLSNRETLKLYCKGLYNFFHENAPHEMLTTLRETTQHILKKNDNDDISLDTIYKMMSVLEYAALKEREQILNTVLSRWYKNIYDQSAQYDLNLTNPSKDENLSTPNNKSGKNY